MAKQALEQIRAAEAEAQRIQDAIPTRVKALLDEAERRSRLLCIRAEEEATAETDAQLALLRERADNLLARSTAAAEEEAEQLRKAVRGRMPDAVKLVVWGIMAKCQ
ncbi:MAG: hypothetical protein IKD37_05395 [Clostridia bacterium]|nr:hypothetical protein [Clostridia bacterium]